MPKVMFRVAYSVSDGHRTEYLATMEKIRKYYSESDVQFVLFEKRGQHNSFEELYIYPDEQSYEQSDDPATNSEISPAIEKIYTLVDNVKYSVSLEV